MAAGAPTFEEYWLAFVRAHSLPSTRRLAVATMSAGIGAAAMGVLARRPLLLLLSPVIAFAPSFLARRLARNSPPSDAAHPLFYALASLKMWHMTVSGTMEGEVARAMAEEPDVDRASPGGSPATPYPRPNMVTDHTLH